jgi:hypothetical protein
MENPFILNPTITITNLKDAIAERIDKIRGILNCVMFAIEFTNDYDELDSSSAFHALWAIDGLLEETDCLRTKLDNMC